MQRPLVSQWAIVGQMARWEALRLWAPSAALGALTVWLGLRPDDADRALEVAAVALAIVLIARVLLAAPSLAAIGRPLALVLGATVLLVGWTLAYARWSSDDGAPLQAAAPVALYALALALFGSSRRGHDSVGAMLKSVLVAYLALCAALLVSRVAPDRGGGLERAVFEASIPGLLAALALLWSFALAASERERRSTRIVAAAAVPMLVATLLLIPSRGAIGALAAGLVAFLLLARTRAVLAAGLAVLAPAVIALYVTHRGGLLPAAGDTGGALVSDGPRVAALLVVASAIAAVLHAGLLAFDGPAGGRARSARWPALAVAAAAAAGVAIAVAIAADLPRELAQVYEQFGRPQAGPDDAGRDRRLDVVAAALMSVVLVTILHGCIARAGAAARPLYSAIAASIVGWAVAAALEWRWQLPVATLWLFALGAAVLAARGTADPARATLLSWPTRLALALIAVAIVVIPIRAALSPGPAGDESAAPTATAPPAEDEAPARRGPVCNIDPDDGHAAIEAAIAACPNGRTVVFPARRTYRQTDRIRVERRRDLVIDGNGSTFVKTSPHGGERGRPNWQLLEVRDVTLQNMTIRGALEPGPRGITPGNQFDHGVIVYGGNGVEVRDVIVRDVFGDFVSTAPSGFVRGGGALGGELPRNVTIKRVDGRSAARMCIALTAGIGLRVEDSKLADCRYAGIDLETDVPGESLRDVQVRRNTIAGYYLFAIGIAGPANSAPKAGDIDGIEIRDNVTSTPSDTCWPAVNAERGPIADVVVAGNRLKTLNQGVKLQSVTSGSVTANRIEITGNPNLCGPPRAIPVQLASSPKVAVSGNTPVGY